MTASRRWRSSAVVKPHHALAAKPTALEAHGCYGCEWRYALLVVQARNDDYDWIGSTLGKLSRVLSVVKNS